MAYADEAEMPKFSKKPIKFISKHEIGTKHNDAGDVLDELLIGDVTNNNLKFWFEFIRTNYHICSMSGTAKATDINVFEYSIDDCRLRITIAPNQAIIEDVGGYCSHSETRQGEGFCGSRAYIGKTTLQIEMERNSVRPTH